MSEVAAKRMRVEGGGRVSAVESRLRRLALEVEQVAVKEDSQVAAYVPSFRASLARQGYLVQRTLGAGSYSKVKTAINCRNKEHIPVAVKIVDKTHAPREYQHKFLPRELETWPKLQHPGIVKLYHTFQDTRFVGISHNIIVSDKSLSMPVFKNYFGNGTKRKYAKKIEKHMVSPKIY